MIRLLISAMAALIHLIFSPLTLALSMALLVGAWWISRQVSLPPIRSAAERLGA